MRGCLGGPKPRGSPWDREPGHRARGTGHATCDAARGIGATKRHAWQRAWLVGSSFHPIVWDRKVSITDVAAKRVDSSGVV